MDLQIPTQWHCDFTDNGIVDTAMDCTVTATTTYRSEVSISNFPTTTNATSTAPFSHDEFLFIIMVAIVLLGVPFWRFLFSWGKK